MMTRKLSVAAVCTELMVLKRPKARATHLIKSLDSRSFKDVDRVKKLFNELKRQKILVVDMDTSQPSFIRFTYNGNSSTFTLRGAK